MGKVVVVMRVMPEDPDKFEAMKARVKETVKAEKIEEEPIAFGLKALKVTVVTSDEEGSGPIEEKIRSIPGVSDVQVVDLGLL